MPVPAASAVSRSMARHLLLFLLVVFPSTYPFQCGKLGLSIREFFLVYHYLHPQLSWRISWALPLVQATGEHRLLPWPVYIVAALDICLHREEATSTALIHHSILLRYQTKID
ncbi:hypothetical protein QR685DRAFT_235359 [Neurospora intermedia]|uniref:Secreted protein n=1 Tax=Neurospora intermedia TaxID=5142 RepID=A0ABR3DIA1_NEUIN